MQIVLPSVLIVFLSVVVQTLAIRCYICGPGAQQPFKNTKAAGGFNSNSPNASGHGYNDSRTSPATRTANINTINSIFTPCDNFEEKSNFLQEFIMECPSQYAGCITEIEGNRTTRTCEILNINDCKIANNITYCYCNTDLCNGEQISILTSRAWKSNDPMENSDDEDFTESSGMDENGYRKQRNRIKSLIDNGESSISTKVATNQKLNFFMWIYILHFIQMHTYIPEIVRRCNLL